MRRVKKIRYNKKRRYRRKPRVYRNRFTTTTSHLPATMGVRLKYFDQIRLDPSPTIPSVHTFRANSLFDPDFTSTGHQPMGFDQYMQLYSRYTVVGSKITITASPSDDTSLNSTAIVGVYMSSDSGFPVPISTLIESEKSRYKVIQLSENALPISTKYSVKKQQGIKNIMDNYELSGTVIANPVIQDYFHVFAAGINSLQDPSRISVQVHISYFVVFSDPLPLIGS